MTAGVFNLNFIPLLPEVFFLLAFLVSFLLVFLSPSAFRFRVSVDGNSLEKTPYLGNSAFWIAISILFVYFILKSTYVFGSASCFFDTIHLTEGLVWYQLFLIACAVLIAFALRRGHKHPIEFWYVYLLFVFSSVLLPSVSDLIGVYLLFELQGFTAYILAALDRGRVLSVEAGLKYFVLGSFTSGFFLFGIALLYVALGTTDLFSASLLAFGLEPHLLVVLGLVFIVGAVLFKLAAFPFHLWVSDIYSGISLSILLVFVVIPKLSLVGFLVKGIFPFLLISGLYGSISAPFMYFGLMGVVFGALGASFQDSFQKFIAYSGIANLGYVVLAFSLGTFEGIFAAVFYMFVYALLLVALVVFGYSLGFPDKEAGVTGVNLLAIFSALPRSYPILGLFLALLLLSMAGVPPLMGFFPKATVISSLWAGGAYTVAVLTALVSVFSAVYYVVLFVRVYIAPKKHLFVLIKDKPLVCLFVCVSIFNLFYLFYHSPVSDYVWYLVVRLF